MQKGIILTEKKALKIAFALASFKLEYYFLYARIKGNRNGGFGGV